MNEPRLGLVLEGGGAKGAYQFGVLKSFKEAGIEFDVVAGTSVGTLNGALWATDSLSRAAEIWTDLSLDKIYPPRVWKWLMYPYAIVLFALNAVIHFADGAISLHDRRSMEALRIASIGLIVGAAIAYFAAEGLSFVAGPMVCVGILALFVSLNEHGYFRTVLISFLGIAGMLLMLAGAGLLFFSMPDGPVRTTLLIAFAIFFTALLSRAAALSQRLLGESLRSLSSRSVLDRMPLKQVVERIISSSDLKIPTFVTVTRRDNLLDPDDYRRTPVASDILGGFLGRGAGEREELYVPRQFIPEYLHINAMSRTDRIDALLASAALPFGIVNSVAIGGTDYVDGGAADNLPLLPLIFPSGCDEIVVVSVNRMSKEFDEFIADQRGRVQKLRRLRELAAPEQQQRARRSATMGRDRNDPPTVLPLRDVPDWPMIEVVAPRDGLGGFLNGTMNFTRAYGLRLVAMGEEDGRAFIARWKGTDQCAEEEMHGN